MKNPHFLRSTVKAGLFALALSAGFAQAGEAPGDFRVSGFGTLGMARTNTDDAQFVRDLYAPDGASQGWTGKVDSLLGVQANYQITERLSGVVQAVSRYRYDRSYTPEISWAFLKYSPTPQLDLRFGRVGTDFFMLSDSRLVGYTYLTVRPPGDYFWSLPFYSINGVDASYTLPVGEGALRLKAFVGDSYERLALAEQVWKLDGSRMSGAYAEYLFGPWQLRASYANIAFKSNLPVRDLLASYAGLIDMNAVERYLQVDGTNTDYYSLGAVYDAGPWQAQLMFNRIRQGNNVYQDSSAAYALLGYRIGSVTPFVGYSKARSQAGPAPSGGPFDVAVMQRFMADSRVNQHTVTLGARWDFAHNMALKVQADAIRGQPDSIFPYRWENAQWNGRMNVFSATLDFIF